MRTRGTKRAAEHRDRVAMLRRTTHGPVRCQWPGGCVNEAVDPDEILSRARGGSIVDPANIALLCRSHHDWKTQHPAEAAAMGVSVSAGPRRVSDPAPTLIDVSDTTAHTPKITLRLKAAGIEFADAIAAETGKSRSDVLRAMFSVASSHRPAVVARLTAPTPKE